MRLSIIFLALFVFLGCGKPTGPPTPKPVYKEEFSEKDLVWIPSGSFTMGWNKGEEDEKPPHVVKLDGYWIGKYEVSNEDFGIFIKISDYKTVAEQQPTFEELFANQRMSPQEREFRLEEFKKNPPKNF